MNTTNSILIGGKFLINSTLNEVVVLTNGIPGSTAKVEPKVMKVLSLLVQNQNRLVTRSDLIREVWDDYGGGEEALMQAISKLRKIFGDSAKGSSVIETIPTQGYRILMESEEVSDEFYHSTSSYSYNSKPRNDSFFFQFWDRLTNPKHLIVFLIISAIVLGILGILSQIIFWS